jgi:hypothetical protein
MEERDPWWQRVVNAKPGRSCRVLYTDGTRTRSLGRVAEVAPTRYSLDPFLSRLLLDGVRAGELLLVEEASGRVIARRPVRGPTA